MAIPVRVADASGRVWAGQTMDLSPFGIRVRGCALPPRTLARVEFDLPGGGPPVTVQSLAVRADPDGVALAFIDLTRAGFAAIREAVDRELLRQPIWVLVVGDDPELANRLADAVEERGHISLVIPDAGDALAYLEQDRPDAVLLDLARAGRGGAALLESFLARMDAAPVLAIADCPDSEAARYLAAGAFDVLPTPVDPTRLRAVLAGLEFRSLEERLEDVGAGAVPDL
jgi:CheY-like chemotaxis protein